MSNIKDGGPAFPVSEEAIARDMTGASLRDYFAIKALQGMLANQHGFQASDEEMFARDAYTLADAMLAQRDK